MTTVIVPGLINTLLIIVIVSIKILLYEHRKSNTNHINVAELGGGGRDPRTPPSPVYNLAVTKG